MGLGDFFRPHRAFSLYRALYAQTARSGLSSSVCDSISVVECTIVIVARGNIHALAGIRLDIPFMFSLLMNMQPLHQFVGSLRRKRETIAIADNLGTMTPGRFRSRSEDRVPAAMDVCIKHNGRLPLGRLLSPSARAD